MLHFVLCWSWSNFSTAPPVLDSRRVLFSPYVKCFYFLARLQWNINWIPRWPHRLPFACSAMRTLALRGGHCKVLRLVEVSYMFSPSRCWSKILLFSSPSDGYWWEKYRFFKQYINTLYAQNVILYLVHLQSMQCKIFAVYLGGLIDGEFRLLACTYMWTESLDWKFIYFLALLIVVVNCIPKLRT